MGSEYLLDMFFNFWLGKKFLLTSYFFDKLDFDFFLYFIKIKNFLVIE